MQKAIWQSVGTLETNPQVPETLQRPLMHHDQPVETQKTTFIIYKPTYSRFKKN